MSKTIPIRAEAPLSIGGLSKATGIPVETLRTWERRYGFPSPERTPSGHRRYTVATADRLKLVQQALELGHRASAVVQCTAEQLHALLLAGNSAPAVRPSTPAVSQISTRVEKWLHHVGVFEGENLERELHVAWSDVGARQFITKLTLEFLRELGDRWVRGEISVAHEHFASERLRDFLTRQWRPLADRNDGPRVICAALSGEQHTLALHLSAVLLALEGLRPTVLGADTPVKEVARAAKSFDAQSVVIAVSQAAEQKVTLGQLLELRSSLPNSMPVVVGGIPFDAPEGILRLYNLEDLSSWAYTLRTLKRAD